MNWLKSLFLENSHNDDCDRTCCCYNDWIPIHIPPRIGKRVLVKSKDGTVNIGHLDIDVPDLWTAYTIEIGEKTYKFNIMEPMEWKKIPQ